jgi:hypothetical protein
VPVPPQGVLFRPGLWIVDRRLVDVKTTQASLFPDLAATDTAAKESEFYPTREGWLVRALWDAADPPLDGSGLSCEMAVGRGHLVRHVVQVCPEARRWVVFEIRPDAMAEATRVAAELGLVLEGSWCADFLAGGGLADTAAVSLFITNPPNSLAAAFLLECRRRAPAADVALLVPLAFITSGERAQLLRDVPLDVYPLGQRPSFDGKGTDQRDHAWVLAGPRRGGRVFPPLFPTSAAPVRCAGCLQDVRGACGALLPDGARCALRRGHGPLVVEGHVPGALRVGFGHWAVCADCSPAAVAHLQELEDAAPPPAAADTNAPQRQEATEPREAPPLWRCLLCECQGDSCEAGDGTLCEREGELCTPCAVLVEAARRVVRQACEDGEREGLLEIAKASGQKLSVVADATILDKAHRYAVKLVQAEADRCDLPLPLWAANVRSGERKKPKRAPVAPAAPPGVLCLLPVDVGGDATWLCQEPSGHAGGCRPSACGWPVLMPGKRSDRPLPSRCSKVHGHAGACDGELDSRYGTRGETGRERQDDREVAEHGAARARRDAGVFARSGDALGDRTPAPSVPLGGSTAGEPSAAADQAPGAVTLIAAELTAADDKPTPIALDRPALAGDVANDASPEEAKGPGERPSLSRARPSPGPVTGAAPRDERAPSIAAPVTAVNDGRHGPGRPRLRGSCADCGCSAANHPPRGGRRRGTSLERGKCVGCERCTGYRPASASYAPRAAAPPASAAASSGRPKEVQRLPYNACGDSLAGLECRRHKGHEGQHGAGDRRWPSALERARQEAAAQLGGVVGGAPLGLAVLGYLEARSPLSRCRFCGVTDRDPGAWCWADLECTRCSTCAELLELVEGMKERGTPLRQAADLLEHNADRPGGRRSARRDAAGVRPAPRVRRAGGAAVKSDRPTTADLPVAPKGQGSRERPAGSGSARQGCLEHARGAEGAGPSLGSFVARKSGQSSPEPATTHQSADLAVWNGDRGASSIDTAPVTDADRAALRAMFSGSPNTPADAMKPQSDPHITAGSHTEHAANEGVRALPVTGDEERTVPCDRRVTRRTRVPATSKRPSATTNAVQEEKRSMRNDGRSEGEASEKQAAAGYPRSVADDERSGENAELEGPYKNPCDERVTEGAPVAPSGARVGPNADGGIDSDPLNDLPEVYREKVRTLRPLGQAPAAPWVTAAWVALRRLLVGTFVSLDAVQEQRQDERKAHRAPRDFQQGFWSVALTRRLLGFLGLHRAIWLAEGISQERDEAARARRVKLQGGDHFQLAHAALLAEAECAENLFDRAVVLANVIVWGLATINDRDQDDPEAEHFRRSCVAELVLELVRQVEQARLIPLGPGAATLRPLVAWAFEMSEGAAANYIGDDPLRAWTAVLDTCREEVPQ